MNVLDLVKTSKMTFILKKSGKEYILMKKLTSGEDEFETIGTFIQLKKAEKYIKNYCTEHNLKLLCVAECKNNELGKFTLYVLDENTNSSKNNI